MPFKALITTEMEIKSTKVPTTLIPFFHMLAPVVAFAKSTFLLIGITFETFSLIPGLR